MTDNRRLVNRSETCVVTFAVSKLSRHSFQTDQPCTGGVLLVDETFARDTPQFVSSQRVVSPWHSRTSHRSQWRPLKPGERSGFAQRCVTRVLDALLVRAPFVFGSDRTRRTLNCFLALHPTHANRAPASAPARADRISAAPSRAGIPHLGGHWWRRVAVRVLLHQADHHLPRLSVRSVPASAPGSPRLSGQIFYRVRSSRARLPGRARRARAVLSRASRGAPHETLVRATSALQRTDHGRAARLTSSPTSTTRSPLSALLSPLARRSVYKDGRAEGVHEGKTRVKEGTQWREHSFRKFMRGVRPQIFPGLNDTMTK